MNTLSRRSVVNQITTELAERRRTSRARRTAYLALALAILGDEHYDLFSSTTLVAQPAALSQSVVAA
jgi:hypothetical protein